jgi:hypothetical protein
MSLKWLYGGRFYVIADNDVAHPDALAVQSQNYRFQLE